MTDELPEIEVYEVLPGRPRSTDEMLFRLTPKYLPIIGDMLHLGTNLETFRVVDRVWMYFSTATENPDQVLDRVKVWLFAERVKS